MLPLATSTPLLGKRALITGSSRGIGLAIAQSFAAAGASCLLTARDSPRLHAALSLLPGTAHAVLPGDVGDAEFWNSVRKNEKNIDILVNAAGTTHYSLLLSTPTSIIEDIIRTNLTGTIFACQAVLKNMLRQKSGCIINISSVMGIKGGRGSAAYAASKAGVLGLTRALADEVGRGAIRVNAIVPGFIATSMTENMSSSAMSDALSATPLNRLGTPEEIASAALFLATNGFVNGCQMVVDGGLSSV